jgi:hypothetical protein
MSLIPVANLQTVVGTGGKFDTSVADTGIKFVVSVVDTRGALWLANISSNFQKIQNDPYATLNGLRADDSWKKAEGKNIMLLSHLKGQ